MPDETTTALPPGGIRVIDMTSLRHGGVCGAVVDGIAVCREICDEIAADNDAGVERR